MQCYSCHNPLPRDARHCPDCGHEVYSRLAGKLVDGRRIDGWRPGPASPKDFHATPNAGMLPRKVDLRQWCSPVEDQGQLGSCTANATAGAMEYQLIRSGKPPSRMSRLFIYYNSRRMTGHETEDAGAQISEAMASVLAFGAPPEEEWPYNPFNFAAQPPQQLYAEAMQNEAVQYARVDRGDGVCGALARGFPVVFGIVLPMECFVWAANTAVIPPPPAGVDPQKDGGHSMLIVGYDLDQKTFLLRNSWGEGWADRGYCSIPFEVMEGNTRDIDFWIFGDLAQDNAFKLARPIAGDSLPPMTGSVSGLSAKLREQMRADLDRDFAQKAQEIRDRLRPKR